MRSLPLPTHQVSVALELCADSVRDGGLKIRLLSARDLLVAAEAEYKAKGVTASLYSIPAAATLGDWVEASEMKNLYANTFARKGGTVRHLYDALRIGAIGGICPLCNQRTVGTLDHHLAKSVHPAYTITPANLVPACMECNLGSQARQPTTASAQTLHPYFHSVDSDIWLVATVQPASPPVLIFSATPPISWPQTKQDMLRSHFEAFKLGALYTTHAAVELVHVYSDLLAMGAASTAQDRHLHLAQQATNRRLGLRNSWQAAMYQALSESTWFCNGGYQQVATSPHLA